MNIIENMIKSIEMVLKIYREDSHESSNETCENCIISQKNASSNNKSHKSKKHVRNYCTISKSKLINNIIQEKLKIFFNCNFIIFHAKLKNDETPPKRKKIQLKIYKFSKVCISSEFKRISTKIC
jgi:hypothetical protein